MGTPRILVSHDSTDEPIYRACTDLLLRALPIGDDDIRCTSIPEHGLEGGAHTSVELQKEVVETEAMIGLVTRNSVASPYCIGEWCARWGAGKRLHLLICAGFDPQILSRLPLVERNCLFAEREGDIDKLVGEVAGILKNIEPRKEWRAERSKLMTATAPERTYELPYILNYMPPGTGVPNGYVPQVAKIDHKDFFAILDDLGDDYCNGEKFRQKVNDPYLSERSPGAPKQRLDGVSCNIKVISHIHQDLLKFKRPK